MTKAKIWSMGIVAAIFACLLAMVLLEEGWPLSSVLVVTVVTVPVVYTGLRFVLR